MFFDCEDGKIVNELDEERDKIIKKINDALDDWCVFLNENEKNNVEFYIKSINYQPHCVDRNKWEFTTYDEYEKHMEREMQAVGRCEEVVPVIHCDPSLSGYPSPFAGVNTRLNRLELEEARCGEACSGR